MSAVTNDELGYLFERTPWNRAWLWPLLSAASMLHAVPTARDALRTRDLRCRVSLLKGILPICGFCKDVAVFRP